MKVEKWGDVLVVPVPDDIADAMGIKPGADVNLSVEVDLPYKAVTPDERAAVIDRIRAMALPLPKDWKFDREEANRRGPE